MSLFGQGEDDFAVGDPLHVHDAVPALEVAPYPVVVTSFDPEGQNEV